MYQNYVETINNVAYGAWGVLESKLNSLVLEVTNANNSIGATVQMNVANKTDSQKWCLVPQDGYFQSGLRTNEGRDLVLEVIDSNEGSSVQLNINTGSLSQKWEMSVMGLKSCLNRFVLEIKQENPFAGAPLWLQSYHGANSQAWIFQSAKAPALRTEG